MESAFETREKILQGLGPVRWLRGAALFGVLFPIGLTALIVLVHKISGGGMSFLASGAPWTHHFWSVIFYTFVGGCVLLFVNLARVCPRCGKGFFKRQGWDPRKVGSSRSAKGSSYGFNVNVFSRRCLNCGLKLDGSNVDEIES